MKPSEVKGALETLSLSQHLKSTATPPNHLHVALAQTYGTGVRTGVDVDTRDKLVDRIKAVC